jgi:glycosyltransferase involved in cell wall biosynthesis
VNPAVLGWGKAPVKQLHQHDSAAPRRPGRIAYVRNPDSGPRPGRCPQVSVVVPSYNYGQYLVDTVRSALTQAGVDPQVIIVDDASSDDSPAIAERLAAADARVTLIRHARNEGHTAAFNTGYEAATGEFIVRLDSDDQLTPGSLARSVALFDAYPQVGLVYGHPVFFTSSGPPPARTTVRSWSVWSGPEWVAERCRRGVNCITSQEAMVRTEVLRRVGPMSTKIRIASDFHLWLRLAAVADVGRVNGCDQSFHRIHPGSITNSADYTQMFDLTERRSVFDDFFSDPGLDRAWAARLHEVATTRLAREALQEACRAYDRGRTDELDVGAFVDFAKSVSPRALEQPDWRALRRRQLVGPRLAPMPPLFTASLAARRLRYKASYRRWCRTGL